MKTEIFNNYRENANFVIQGYIRARKGLRRLAKIEDNVTLLDLSTAFNGRDGKQFRDDVHFYAPDYRVVSKRISDMIAEILKGRQ